MGRFAVSRTAHLLYRHHWFAIAKMRRKRGFLVSRRAWLTQVLLSRLRALRDPSVTDAALRLLARDTALRLSDAGGAYGELDMALTNARELLSALSKAAPNRQPVTAALLRRLSRERKLPHVPPWL